MNKTESFFAEVKENISRMGNVAEVKQKTHDWVESIAPYKYSYNFTWMGRPIIQYPQDIVAMQEIIWTVKPQLIIETGIAHGGSLIFYASMLELLGNDGHVVGINIEIFSHNRAEIEKHPMFKRITLVEGSSTDGQIVGQVKQLARGKDRLELQGFFAGHGIKLFTAIHPRAYVARDASVGIGCHLLANSVVASESFLGDACIVNTSASVDHDCILGDGVHIGPGANLAGSVQVGENSFIGTGAIVLPRIVIGKNVVVGAGAVVTKNVSDNLIVIGNPARIISKK